MNPFSEADLVKYQCDCGRFLKFQFLYFCCYCGELRCRDCTLTEIDSRYCPRCLEKSFTQEAADKRNRCNSCYECPLCSSFLLPKATKSSHNQQNDNSDPSKANYMYYYVCGYCHWTTQEAGIELKSKLNVGWTDWTNEIQSSQELDKLSEFYKKFALLDRVERTKKKGERRKSSLKPIVTDEYAGMKSPLIKRGLLSNAEPDQIEPKPDAIVYKTGDLKFSINDVSDDFKKMHNSSYARTLDEMFKMPGIVKPAAGPVGISMFTHLTRRCEKCSHLIVKRETNTAINEFKICRTTLRYVPEIRLWYWMKSSRRKSAHECDGVDLIVVFVNRSDCALKAKILESYDESPEFNARIVDHPTETFWLLSQNDVSTAGSFAVKSTVEPASNDECRKPWFIHRSRCKLAIKLRVQPAENEYQKLCFPLSFEHQVELINDDPCEDPKSPPPPLSRSLKQSIIIRLPKHSPAPPSFLIPTNLAKRMIADGIKSTPEHHLPS